MRIAYIFRFAQSLDYMMTAIDGHTETWSYLSRYYDVHVFAPGPWNGEFTRNGYMVHGRSDMGELLKALNAYDPDAVCCYGAVNEPEWPDVRAACPRAVLCLDYAGGPLITPNGEPEPGLLQFDHVFTAHETQAKRLRDVGVSASKARGVPTNHFRPIPGVPKQWHVFCPTTFSPGKRPGLVAQYLEQYAPQKPSLFTGAFENPQVIDMVRCGNIPLNKPGVPQRNNIELGHRAPFVTMPLLFNASEVVICGSQEEAGPWVVMEALACGVPAIVMSDCDWWVAEQFKEIEATYGRWGVLVADPWPQAIHEAVVDIMANYDEHSREARGIAVRNYDWWNMYEEIDKRLKNLVALKQSGQPRPEGV